MLTFTHIANKSFQDTELMKRPVTSPDINLIKEKLALCNYKEWATIFKLRILEYN